jgi:hypothetical protein
MKLEGVGSLVGLESASCFDCAEVRHNYLPPPLAKTLPIDESEEKASKLRLLGSHPVANGNSSGMLYSGLGSSITGRRNDP